MTDSFTLDLQLLGYAEELERRGYAGRTARLLPKTALYCAAGLRTYVATPDRYYSVLFLCSQTPRCSDYCPTCVGRADLIHEHYTAARQPPRTHVSEKLIVPSAVRRDARDRRG